MTKKIRIFTLTDWEEVDGYETGVPGLVVTPFLPKNSKEITEALGYSITHETSGMALSYRFTGSKDEMIELAAKLAGPDWTRPSALIYQNPQPYQEAMRLAVGETEEGARRWFKLNKPEMEVP